MATGRIIFTVISLLMALNAAAGLPADSADEKSRAAELYEWGMGLGYGFVNEDIPEGNYGPFLLTAIIEIQIHKRDLETGGRHRFLFYGEPQLCPVLVGGGIEEWELGLGLGLKYRVGIGDRSALFFHGGSGPQYLSLDSPGGFQFASHAGLGFQRNFKRDVRISFAYRFRHISDLGGDGPDGGLQNHFFTIGFARDFARRVQQRRARNAVDAPQ